MTSCIPDLRMSSCSLLGHDKREVFYPCGRIGRNKLFLCYGAESLLYTSIISEPVYAVRCICMSLVCPLKNILRFSVGYFIKQTAWYENSQNEKNKDDYFLFFIPVMSYISLNSAFKVKGYYIKNLNFRKMETTNYTQYSVYVFVYTLSNYSKINIVS